MCSHAAPKRRANRAQSDDLDNGDMPQRKRARYEITVAGALDVDWSSWFEGLTITVQEPSESSPISVLCVDLLDQAQLRGILAQILDLNLTLVSVRSLD